MSDYSSSFYRAVSRYQENLLEEAKSFVGSWLSQQDDFEGAVDWLFGDEGTEMLESQQGTFAFDMMAYAIQSFHNSSDYSDEDDDSDSDDEDDDEGSESDRSEFYDQVRDFFGC